MLPCVKATFSLPLERLVFIHRLWGQSVTCDLALENEKSGSYPWAVPIGDDGLTLGASDRKFGTQVFAAQDFTRKLLQP